MKGMLVGISDALSLAPVTDEKVTKIAKRGTKNLKPDKETYLGSDGSIETYPQIYQPTEDAIEMAEGLEKYIIEQQVTIESSFLKIGAALLKFEQEELWTARGLPSFRVWMESPFFHFSYEHGTRLMRIVRDLVPILGDDTKDFPIATLKELLPMIAEGVSEEAIRAAAEDVKRLTTKDAKKYLRELRGIGSGTPPITFKLTYRKGTEYNRYDVTVFHHESGDAYTMLKDGAVKKRDWAAFIASINGTWLVEEGV